MFISLYLRLIILTAGTLLPFFWIVVMLAGVIVFNIWPQPVHSHWYYVSAIVLAIVASVLFSWVSAKRQ